MPEHEDGGGHPDESGDRAADPLGARQLCVRSTPRRVTPIHTCGKRDLEKRDPEEAEGGENRGRAAGLLTRLDELHLPKWLHLVSPLASARGDTESPRRGSETVAPSNRIG